MNRDETHLSSAWSGKNRERGKHSTAESKGSCVLINDVADHCTCLSSSLSVCRPPRLSLTIPKSSPFHVHILVAGLVLFFRSLQQLVDG